MNLEIELTLARKTDKFSFHTLLLKFQNGEKLLIHAIEKGLANKLSERLKWVNYLSINHLITSKAFSTTCIMNNLKWSIMATAKIRNDLTNDGFTFKCYSGAKIFNKKDYTVIHQSDVELTNQGDNLIIQHTETKRIHLVSSIDFNFDGDLT